MAKNYCDHIREWSDTFNSKKHCRLVFCGSEEAWLRERQNYICASEAANLIGVGFRDNVSVWEDKIGIGKPIEQNELMEKGKKAEAHIRDLWAIDHEVEVYDGTHVVCVRTDMLDVNGNSFMSATLDGWFIDSDGEPCILEIKRSESPKVFLKDECPQRYTAQIFHQMAVTGFKKACLVAHICWAENYSAKELLSTRREYWFDGNDDTISRDINLLTDIEKKFWHKYVLTKTRPPKLLPAI